MKTIGKRMVSLVVLAALGTTLVGYAALSKTDLSVHSETRPQPAYMAPPERFGDPPADAIILKASEWRSDKGGGPAKWKVVKDENGLEYIEAVKKAGGIHTAQQFGNCQLHIEWRTPAVVKDRGQGRGNSGVFFMGRYELQVLDSYENPTYADGQAASIYSQVPPLKNVCRKPGEWQSYDVCFLRPIFDKSGKVVRKGRITVFHNGVAVHNNYEIQGLTQHKRVAAYPRGGHGDKGPLSLQDHGNPIAYRNIWIRELPEEIPSNQPYIKKPGEK